MYKIPKKFIELAISIQIKINFQCLKINKTNILQGILAKFTILTIKQ